jgi:hypothetical protein
VDELDAAIARRNDWFHQADASLAKAEQAIADFDATLAAGARMSEHWRRRGEQRAHQQDQPTGD